MRVAYLFFVYKNPKLIEKSIERLRSENSTFFIHVDKKFDIAPFEHLRAPDVFFSENRIPVHWAEYSGVEATLLLIRQALAASKQHDYLVLMSGSEYPLRSAQYIEQYLAANRGAEFISMMKMPAPGKPLSRINTLRYPSSRPAYRLAFRILAKIGLAKTDYRRYLGNLDPYSGITWWTLTREACEYIVEFSERNPGFCEFFHQVFAPEETYFHTILGNSQFKSRIRRNLLYEDWSNPGIRPPAILTEQHMAFFESQEAVTLKDVYGPGELLFARKFTDEGLDLTEKVDRMIVQKDRKPSGVYQ